MSKKFSKKDVLAMLTGVGMTPPETATTAQLYTLYVQEKGQDNPEFREEAAKMEEEIFPAEKEIQLLELRKKILELKKSIEELQGEEAIKHDTNRGPEVTDVESMVNMFTRDDDYDISTFFYDLDAALEIKPMPDASKQMNLRCLLRGTGAMYLKTTRATTYTQLRLKPVEEFKRSFLMKKFIGG